MTDLDAADVTIGPDGTPRSTRSDDVYFSADGGLAETRHVFLDGIDAPTCWQLRPQFRIGELGFGTGLNFLSTWHLWQETAPADATLDYISIERFPLTKGELLSALAPVQDELMNVSELANALPIRVPGLHRCVLDRGRVRLTLMYGDVRDMLSAMEGHVDAWYLDGFSPAKNPDMWSADVLAAVAKRLAPGGRLATFTAAGEVRRTLQGLGLEVTKRPGFARKRECIHATKPGHTDIPDIKTVAVVGGGVAGGAVARALMARGLTPTVFDPTPGNGASGNPAALLAPRLPREQTKLGRILASSYLYAVSFYDALTEGGANIWHGARGAFAMARNEDEDDRQRKALAAFGWPEDVMRRIGPEEASQLTGAAIDKSGLWFPNAGTLNPRVIVSALLNGVHIMTDRVAGVRAENDGIVIETSAGQHAFGAVVMCAGAEVLNLIPGLGWPMRANRGQLALLSPLDKEITAPITYGGYISPKVSTPDGDVHVLGATYGRRDEMPDEDWSKLRPEDDQKMIEAFRDHLPSDVDPTVVGGRTAVRATVRDYIPIAGLVSSGVYALTGLGSRGFLTAPLMAELVADQITGAPLPLPSDLVAATSPRRFD